jgi:hypothetical protein
MAGEVIADLDLAVWHLGICHAEDPADDRVARRAGQPRDSHVRIYN